MYKKKDLEELRTIPGVGTSVSRNFFDIGIKKISDLKGKDPETLYEKSNRFAGKRQDRCLLYVFRCAVYFAETEYPKPDKLKWWNWKD